MKQPCEGRWIAIQVRPGAEYVALAGLCSRGYETYLPIYYSIRQRSDRVSKLRRPLFPGYLFCKFSSAIRAPIVTASGVVKILGVNGAPTPVADNEIMSLQAIEAATGINAYPWPQPEVGDTVCICEGPLRGVSGVLQLVRGKDTLIVSIPLLQRAVAVEVRYEWILPIRARA
jgi:transcription termination/antitermination protein NusG